MKGRGRWEGWEVALLSGLFEKWQGNEARREVESEMMEGGEGDGDVGMVGS